MDEKVIKQIVNENVKCKKTEDRLKITVYYKSATTKSLIMKNNHNSPPSKFQECNLVYEYKCKLDGCEHLQNNSYIGHTVTTLSRRLTMHLQTGGPKNHCRDSHSTQLTRSMLEEGTSILRREQDENRLRIMEALLIQKENPTINRQTTGQDRTLKLYSLPLILPDH